MLNNINRKFILGSEWLSYKLYMGTKTADNFIKSELIEITKILVEKKYIDNWFFIRYYDTDFHLRIRFHLTDTSNISKVVELVYDTIIKYVQSNLINKVMLDTYSRELERYGINTMTFSENLFCINSKTVIDVLNIIDEDEELRWLLCLKTIDILLNEFNYSLKQKRDLLLELKSDFGNEFGMNKQIRRQLSLKFRNNRNKIEDIIDNQSILNERKIDYKKLYHEFPEKEEFLFPSNFNALMYSYIHMNCNRLFSSKHRKNEWVVYDLLYQYYYSTYARKNTTKK